MSISGDPPAILFRLEPGHPLTPGHAFLVPPTAATNQNSSLAAGTSDSVNNPVHHSARHSPKRGSSFFQSSFNFSFFAKPLLRHTTAPTSRSHLPSLSDRLPTHATFSKLLCSAANRNAIAAEPDFNRPGQPSATVGPSHYPATLRRAIHGWSLALHRSSLFAFDTVHRLVHASLPAIMVGSKKRFSLHKLINRVSTLGRPKDPTDPDDDSHLTPTRPASWSPGVAPSPAGPGSAAPTATASASTTLSRYSKMAEEEDFSSLPLTDRWVHKVGHGYAHHNTCSLP